MYTHARGHSRSLLIWCSPTLPLPFSSECMMHRRVHWCTASQTSMQTLLWHSLSTQQVQSPHALLSGGCWEWLWWWRVVSVCLSVCLYLELATNEDHVSMQLSHTCSVSHTHTHHTHTHTPHTHTFSLSHTMYTHTPRISFALPSCCRPLPCDGVQGQTRARV